MKKNYNKFKSKLIKMLLKTNWLNAKKTLKKVFELSNDLKENDYCGIIHKLFIKKMNKFNIDSLDNLGI